MKDKLWYKVITAPFMGLIFAMFLPLVGIFGLIFAIGKLVQIKLLNSSTLNSLMFFGWRPYYSYLLGGGKKKKTPSSSTSNNNNNNE